MKSHTSTAIIPILLLSLFVASSVAAKPNVLPAAFRFTDTPLPSSDGMLVVEAGRDINNVEDFIEVFGEGTSGDFLGDLFREEVENSCGIPGEDIPPHTEEGADCVGFEGVGTATDSIIIPQSMLADFAANGFVRFVLIPSSAVGLLEYVSVRLTYDTSGGVYDQAIVSGPGFGLLGRSGGKPVFPARNLSGVQEVPPVDTPATGKAKFGLEASGSELGFNLRVRDLVEVTAAHIHCAPPGQNGPIGITLFSDGPVTQTKFQGTVAEPLDPNDCDWANLDNAVIELRQGNTYVNVHTPAFPGGEIRGQVTGQRPFRN